MILVAVAYSLLGLKADFIDGCDEYGVTPGKISEFLWLLSFLSYPKKEASDSHCAICMA